MSTTTPDAHLDFHEVHVSYAKHVDALRGVSLRIARGEFVFLTGSTGAGKSTLLKLITAEIRATHGIVRHTGEDVARYRPRNLHRLRRLMGVVPQDFALLPRKKVWENVAYAMRAVGHRRREVRRRVPQILSEVHVAHRADAFPSELSGGEQQRVAIGRALINRPPLILADEPTGNLDSDRSWEIMEILLRLNAEGATVVVATHDLPIVERAGKRVVHMEKGRIVSDRRPTE